MKKLTASAIGVMLLASSLFAGAQEQKLPINEPDQNKPKLFADLPQKMTLKLSEMENMFAFNMGASVTVQATDKMIFQGTIVSKSDANNSGLQSVVIRSTSRIGATLTFTRTTNADGSFNYIGRIMSRDHGDAYEITKENGIYIFQKINPYDLISE
jgi:hypothetical protein